MDRNGHVVSEQTLYVEGNVAPDADGHAVGPYTAPVAPGSYILTCDLVAFGAPDMRDTLTLRVSLDVREHVQVTENSGVSL